MSFGRCSLSSAKNKSVQSIDSHVYNCSNLRWKPCCRCGDIVVFRRARRVSNYGKFFWGCPHFKGYNHAGCDFFDWFYEEVGDEKEQFMMKHQSRMNMLTKEIEEVKREVEGLRLSNVELEVALKNLIKWK